MNALAEALPPRYYAGENAKNETKSARQGGVEQVPPTSCQEHVDGNGGVIKVFDLENRPRDRPDGIRNHRQLE